MKFSQQRGYTPVSDVIQTEGMSDELRISLWNVLDLDIWSGTLVGLGDLIAFSQDLWFSYFKLPVDLLPEQTYPSDLSWKKICSEIREYFFKCMWYEVYDFLEFTLKHFKKNRLNNAVNFVLERELAGYRYVGDAITDITNREGIESIETALADKDFPGVQAHFRRALELLSDRESPDYRNSIKESISAVESLARSVTGKPKVMLPDALKMFERSGKLHPALKEGFIRLYGYTSDKGGIRHSMMDDPNLTAGDAKFFLVSCSAFVNYLKSKM